MCDVLAPPDPSLGHLGPLQAPRKTLICMNNWCNQYFLYLVSTFLKSCLVMLWHHQSLHWATGPLQAPEASQTVDMHEKSMQPRFVIFCFYLPKKLFGDVWVYVYKISSSWADSGGLQSEKMEVTHFRYINKTIL